MAGAMKGKGRKGFRLHDTMIKCKCFLITLHISSRTDSAFRASRSKTLLIPSKKMPMECGVVL